MALGTPDWAVVAELPIDEADKAVRNGLLWSIIVTVLIAIAAGVIGVFLARQLSVPLIKLTKTATRIAEGELELAADVAGPKEVATLASVFNQSNKYLTEIISKTKELTLHLNSSTKEIEVATIEQTSASSQSVSGITEVSATMSELSATAKQITHNIGELVISSQESVKFLKESENKLRLIVNQLKEAKDISLKNTREIEELGKQSLIINDMVELIKEVASKTNILSINASIEASRNAAGGTGFAVVAQEIRQLSKETIESAKKAELAGREIRDFLNSIIVSSTSESEKVVNSAKITEEIFNNIENIIEKINKNDTFIQKIDLSIKQQENGSLEVAATMKQMTEVARQSSEIAHNILLAVKGIVGLSTSLENVVSAR